MATPSDPNIVMPSQLAKELKIRPQLIFGWIRNKNVTSHECVCGHKYLLRSEIADFLTRRAQAEEEKQAQIQRELAGEIDDLEAATEGG